MTFSKSFAKHRQVVFTALLLIVLLVPINAALSIYTNQQRLDQETVAAANSSIMEKLKIEAQNRQNRNQLLESRNQTPASILDQPKQIIPLTEFDSIGQAKELFGPKINTDLNIKNTAPTPNQILDEALNKAQTGTQTEDKVSALNSILGVPVQAQSSSPFLNGFGSGQIELPWTAGQDWTLTSGYNSSVHSGKTAYLLNFAKPGGSFGAPVLAMSSGVVVDYANTCRSFDQIYGCNDGWGYYVILKVADGAGNTKHIQYDHLSQVAVSGLGQEIPIGQEIGQAGDTGFSQGSHIQVGLASEPSSGVWSRYATMPFPTVKGLNVTTGENPITTFAGKDRNKFRSTNVGGNADLDGDNISNLEDNCPETPNPDQKDSNGDGLGDVCDRDGDGVEDYLDNCVPPNPWDGTGAEYFFNPDQSDSDGNGVGNTCDAPKCDQPNQAEPGSILFYLCSLDWDKDGVENMADNCPWEINPDQLDANQNGVGDACDASMKVARKYFNTKPAYYRNMGYDIPSGVIGDPINPSSGNFYQQENDFNLPGPAKGVQEGIAPELNLSTGGLNIERVYNSVDNRKGVFGKGWNSNLLTFVDFYDQNQYGISQTGGNMDVFEKSTTCEQVDNSKPDCYAFKALEASTDTTAKLNFLAASTFKAAELAWAQSCALPKEMGNMEQGYQEFLKNPPLLKNSPNLIGGQLIQAPKTEVVYPDCFNFNYTDKFGSTTIYHWDTTTDTDPSNDWKAGLPILTKKSDGQIMLYEFAKNDQEQSPNSIQNFKYLKSIANNFGQKISFEFDTAGLITKTQDNLGRAYQYSYDLDGNLIQVGKPSPNLSPAMDSQGKFANTKYSYNLAGFLTTITDPTGRIIVDNKYNDQGKVVSQQDASGKTTTLEYTFDTTTGISSKTSSTLRNGGKIEHSFDTLGRLIKQVDELGAVQTTEYKASSYAKTKSVDALGRATLYEYDEQNNPIKITLPEGTITQNEFDSNSKITSKTQGDRSWKFEYSDHKLISKTDPAGNSTTFSYNQKSFEGILPTLEPEKQAKLPAGLKNTAALNDIDKFTVLASFSDSNQNQTKYNYNPQNQVESIQNPDGGQTKLGPDPVGRLIQRQSPAGGITKISLDGQNNVAQTENSLGGKTKYTYFENGLLRAKIDPSGLISTYNHNPNKKLILARQCLQADNIENCEQKPNNPIFYDQNNPNGIGFEIASTLSFADRYKSLDHYDTVFEYDSEDFLTKTVDPEGKITSYKVDLKGQRLETILPDGNTLKNEYDLAGNTTKFTDELNRETQYTFDALDRLTGTTRPDGAVKSLKYNSFGNITEVKDFDAQASLYSYDQRDNLVAVTDKLGRSSSFEYDQNSNQTKSFDALGGLSTQSYDSSNRATSLIKPNGLNIRLGYNLTGQVISKQYLSQSGEALNSEKYGYDQAGNLTQKTNALGGTEVLSYDSSFRVTQRQVYLGDPASSAVYAKNSFGYDRLGRQISQTDPQGYQTSSTYSPANKLVEYKDRRGNKNQYHFDSRNNPIKQTNEIGDSQYLSYNPDNTLKCQTSFKTLDASLLVSSQNGLQNPEYGFEKASLADGYDALQGKESTCYQYDNLQRIVQSTDPLGQKTSYSYDINGNATALTNPKGQTTKYSYDAQNNLLETTDTGGFKSSFSYDSLNRVVAQTNSKNQTTQLFYDAVGNQTGIIYPNSNTGQSSNTTGSLDSSKISALQAQGFAINRFEYNQLSSKISLTDPNNQVIKYGYNAANLISKIIDASGNTTNYSYDTLLRQNQIVYPTGGFDTLSYDNRGNLSSKTDRFKALTKYSYDPNQNLVIEISPLNNEIRYSYDNKNRIVQVSDSISRQNQLNSSLSNGLSLIQDSGQGLVQAYQYDQNDKLISNTDAFGNQENQVYDPLGRLVQIITDDLSEDKLGSEYKFGSTQNVKPNQRVSKSYQYDRVGLLTQSSDELGHKTSFGYNSQNNLIQTTAPNGAQNQLELDSLGNLLGSSDALNRITKYKLDGLNRQIESLDANGGVSKFSFDLASNQVSNTNPKGNTTTSKYVKLQDYKLAQSTDPLSFTQNFGYDGLGRVAQKQDQNGNKYSYLYDDTNRYYQENQPENVTLKHTLNAVGQTQKYIDGKNIAYSFQFDQRGRQTQSRNPDGGQTSTIFDPLNRATQNINPNSGVVQTAYGPRGELLAQKQPDGELKYSQYDQKLRLSAQILPTTAKNTTLVAASNSPERGTKLALNSFEYDQVDNLTLKSDVFGSQTKYSYDLVQNQLSSTDPKGGVYNYSFDKLNNLLASKDPLGSQTNYKYDPNSNLTLVADPKGGNIKLEYTKRDELKLKTDQLSRTNQYFYDGNGNEINFIKADGLARVQAFDGLDRLKVRQYQTQASSLIEPGSFSFKYDQNSNLSQANQVLANAAGQAKLTFDYDLLNRIKTQQTQNQGIFKAANQIEYSYDKNSNLTSELIAKLDPVSQSTQKLQKQNFSYTLGNKLENLQSFALGGDSSNLVNSLKLSYDPAGQLLNRTNQNGQISDTYSYDLKGRILSSIAPGRLASRSEKETVDYTGFKDRKYDVLDRVVSQYNFSHGLEQLGYDALSRLTSYDNDLNQQTYSYDSTGNRTKVSSQSLQNQGQPKNIEITNNYDTASQLTDSYTPYGNISYKYDLNGNQIQSFNNGFLTAQSYFDGENKPIYEFNYTADTKNQAGKSDLSNPKSEPNSNSNSQTTQVSVKYQQNDYLFRQVGRLTLVSDQELKVEQAKTKIADLNQILLSGDLTGAYKEQAKTNLLQRYSQILGSGATKENGAAQGSSNSKSETESKEKAPANNNGNNSDKKSDKTSRAATILNKLAFMDLDVRAAPNAPKQDAVNSGGNTNNGGCNNTGAGNNGGGNNNCNPVTPTPVTPPTSPTGPATTPGSGSPGTTPANPNTPTPPATNPNTPGTPTAPGTTIPLEAAPESNLIFANPSKLEVLVGDHVARNRDQVEAASLSNSILLTQALDAVGLSQVQIDNQNYRQFSYDATLQDFGKYTQTPLLGTSFKNKTKINPAQNQASELINASEIELINQKTLPVSIAYNSNSTQINLYTPSQNRASSSDPMGMNFGSPTRRLMGATAYTQRNDYILAPSFDFALDSSLIPAQYKAEKSADQSQNPASNTTGNSDNTLKSGSNIDSNIDLNLDSKAKEKTNLNSPNNDPKSSANNNPKTKPKDNPKNQASNPKDLIQSLKDSDLSYSYVPNTLSDLTPDTFNTSTKLAPELNLTGASQTQLSFQNSYNYHSDYLNTLHSVTQTKDTLTFTDLYGPYQTVRAQNQNSVQNITQDNSNAGTVLTQSFDPFGQTLTQNEYPYRLVPGLFTNKGQGDSGNTGNKLQSTLEKDCKSQSVNSQNCNQVSNFNYQKPIFAFSGAQNESYSSSIPEYQGDSGLIKAKGNRDTIDNLGETNKKKPSQKNPGANIFDPSTPELNFGRRNFAPDTGTFTAQDPVVNGYSYNTNGTSHQIGLNHSNTLGGFLKQTQGQNPYLLVTNNPMSAKDVDGYCILGMGCENQNRAHEDIRQATQTNNQIQDRAAEIERKNQELSQKSDDAKSKINGDVDNLKNNISSFNDKSANLNKSIESGAYLIRNVYVPDWRDYAGSAEKLYNDALSGHIAFAAICSGDTKPPYGCNSHHSQIAQNYDLSVSPNVKGFAKYQAANTKVWYTVDEARLNADVSSLRSEADKLAADQKNIQDYAATISKELTQSSDSLQKDITNLTQEAEQNRQKLDGANKVLGDTQMFNNIATIALGVGAGIACTVATGGTGVFLCAGIGASIAGVGNANSQYISKGSLGAINLGEVGINAAIGGISNLVAPGLGSTLTKAGVKGLSNAVIVGALIGGGSGGLLDLGTQLANNNFNLGTVNYNQTLSATGNGTVAGAVGGGVGYGVGVIGSRVRWMSPSSTNNITDDISNSVDNIGCVSKIDPKDILNQNEAKLALLGGLVGVGACSISPQRKTHILDGDSTGGGHGPGRGIANKSEFPNSLTDDQIIEGIESIANNPSNYPNGIMPTQNQRVVITGDINGVNTTVVVNPATEEVITAWPTNVPRNP